MHEGDLEPEHAAPRPRVDQLCALLRESLERGVHVVHLIGDVVHAGPTLRKEPADRSVVTERGNELHATLADTHRRRLDALLFDPLAVLEPPAEQPLVRRHGRVEIVHGDADVVNASCLHGGDGTVAHMVRRLVIALVAVAGLAGCGGGERDNGEAEKPPEQVVADAQNAATAAKSVHVAGAIRSSGTELSLDLELVQGPRAMGSMAQSKLRFEIIRVGDKAYIKGSDAFLRRFAGPAGAKLLHGKWLEGSATHGNLAALDPLTDLAKLARGALGSHGKLRNAGETEYRGRKVVAIKDLTRGGTLYVAATGTPYPVAIVGGTQRGEIRFDKWNDSATVEAPAGAVDLQSIGR
jgi:hypothetical protein